VKFLTRKHTRRRPHTGRSVQKASKIPNAVSIDKRHYLVNTRTTIGHWESDLMEGVRGEPTALSVEAERLTKYVKLTLVANKTSSQKTQALQTALTPLPKRIRKTITVDNGSENHQQTIWNTILTVKTYVAHPYHSWEKGTVENTIGRIRRYIPKGSSLLPFAQKDIMEIEKQMNNTPRKCLGYKTPAEMVRELLQYKTTYKPTWCTSG
jgi:transposase, IS30 family